MERDEEGTYARIGDLRRNVFEPRLSEHHGKPVDLVEPLTRPPIRIEWNRSQLLHSMMIATIKPA